MTTLNTTEQKAEAKVILGDFKKRLDPRISAFFARTKEDAVHEDGLVRDAIEHMEDIVVSGGKRLRAALMYYAYLGVGGQDREAMLDTAVSVELIHAFLLVHDDIIDRDTLRHGVKTLHERYRELALAHFPGKDSEHFGNSIAIILGDMLHTFGNDIIFRAPFDKEAIFAALSCLQRIVSLTVVGQARDIYIEYEGTASEEEILKMYENKTARYSIEGPLHLGALLGGGKKETLAKFSAYAVPLGIAYQIQDDIIGIFGTEKEIGKPVGSDIQEGKYTILVAKAVKLGTKAQVKRLRELLELKEAVTVAHISEFQAILQETGALAATEAMAAEYIAEGVQALSPLREDLTPEAYEFMEALTAYIIGRKY